MIEYCQIELTQGQIARVSPEDFGEISKYRWYAQWSPITKSFYAVRSAPKLNGKRASIKMHRQIMGDPAGLRVDHIHHDTLDNRRSELRIATISENNQNARKRSDNSSGFKGVNWHGQRKKWQAWIGAHGKRSSLGLYKTAEEAHAAYCAAATKYHGEFARVS